jgi:DNA-directed RNA polymerase specialized sigma24 family protein
MADDGAEISDLLRAVVALLSDDRERQIAKEPGPEKTELILSACGLTAQQIARLLGKQPDAVRKTLSRARQRGAGTTEDASA